MDTQPCILRILGGNRDEYLLTNKGLKSIRYICDTSHSVWPGYSQSVSETEARETETQRTETNRASDSDTDNTDTGPLDGSYLAKYCHPVVWIAVSNKNGHILDAATVAVCMVEDLSPHQSEPIGSVRTSATILNLSDCIYYIAFDSKTGQIEVECCFVSYTRSNTTDSNSIHV